MNILVFYTFLLDYSHLKLNGENKKKKTNNQHYQVSIHTHEQVARMTESSVTYPIRCSPNSGGICFLK